ncbi:MAG: EAL domain-containing protein [Thermoleophilaceae bacterium]|nr:EAL domain-containing protein [Thermoleophilaceae bacterium]
MLPLVPLFAAVFVALLAGALVTHFRDEATRMSDVRLTLAHLGAQANRLDGLEWRAISEGRVDVEGSNETQRVISRARTEIASLGSTADGDLGASFERYVDALEREYALLSPSRPRPAAAREVDEQEVDPAFARLRRQLSATAGRLSREARSIDSRAATTSRLILAGATLAVIALLILFYRKRQQALAGTVRQEELERRVRLTDDLARQREHDANHDELTGLANRRHFLHCLDEEVAVALKRGFRMAVLVIDLNQFKEINDTLGHQAGDEVLQMVGPRLQGALRDRDVLTRIGGDEFALVVGSGSLLDADTVCGLAERIADALDRPFDFHGLALQVGASIGIAICPDHGRDGETLVRHADVAMYRAKAERTSHLLYAPERDATSRAKLELGAELRSALEDDRLTVHYQPKADLKTGAVRSVEALVRWAHPIRGLVPPDEFLPIAEQLGLMPRLTETVLDKAISQCAGWRADGLDLSVAVNLSQTNLADDTLPATVADLLGKHRLPADRLRLEITETLIMADPAHASRIIAALSALGTTLSLDDFGTGYSSLSYLKRLNVQEIKIDRSFIKNIDTDEGDATIVRSTVELARNLDLHVVAEGVETQAAWELLCSYGCHQAQGYYISPPLPPDDFRIWLANRPGRAAMTPKEQFAIPRDHITPQR